MIELYYFDNGRLIRWIDQDNVVHDNETDNKTYTERGEKYLNLAEEYREELGSIRLNMPAHAIKERCAVIMKIISGAAVSSCLRTIRVRAMSAPGISTRESCLCWLFSMEWGARAAARWPLIWLRSPVENFIRGTGR